MLLTFAVCQLWHSRLLLFWWHRVAVEWICDWSDQQGLKHVERVAGLCVVWDSQANRVTEAAGPDREWVPFRDCGWAVVEYAARLCRLHYAAWVCEQLGCRLR